MIWSWKTSKKNGGLRKFFIGPSEILLGIRKMKQRQKALKILKKLQIESIPICLAHI